MDIKPLPPEHLKAGRDYLAALRHLGLDPEGLLWAEDKTFGEFVLVLITGQFDVVGPTAIYDLLTKAYNRAGTPQAISPFIIRLHSPQQAIVAELRKAYGWDIRVDPFPGAPKGVWAHIGLTVGDLHFEPTWVYHIRERKVAPAERSRRWNRFKTRVEALAA